MYETAITTNRNVDTGILEVFVTGFGHVNHGCCLSAADTFLLAGDTDGTSTDAHFDKVSPGFHQITESGLIYHVSGTNEYFAVVFLFNPL